MYTFHGNLQYCLYCVKNQCSLIKSSSTRCLQNTRVRCLYHINFSFEFPSPGTFFMQKLHPLKILIKHNISTNYYNISAQICSLRKATRKYSPKRQALCNKHDTYKERGSNRNTHNLGRNVVIIRRNVMLDRRFHV